jgi:hypothetical protein
LNDADPPSHPQSFRGRAWQRTTLLTATVFPGLAFMLMLFVNCWLSVYHSAGAVPFLQILSVFALWLCVSVPLVFFGAFFGYKKVRPLAGAGDEEELAAAARQQPTRAPTTDASANNRCERQQPTRAPTTDASANN